MRTPTSGSTHQAARPSARPDLPERQVRGHDERRHEDVVHADAAHHVAHPVDRHEGRGQDGDPAPAEHRGGEQVDEPDEDRRRRRSPTRRHAKALLPVSIATSSRHRPVLTSRRPWSSPCAVEAMSKAIASGADGSSRGVEGGDPDRPVPARLEVRLDRPGLRAHRRRDAGHRR